MTDASRRLALLGLGLILALHAAALAAYHVPVLGSSDANGYHVTARMLVERGSVEQPPKDDDYAFLGEMWVLTDDGGIYPKYPPLYPLLAALAMAVGGDRAGLAVSPAFAWLAVLGAYVLGRALLPRWAALFLAWIVATCPVLNSLAVLPHSHAVSVGLLTWGYALLLHASPQRGRRSRHALLVGAGLLIGYSVGVRYTNALMALPAVLWLLLRWRQRQSGWSELVALGAGLAVPVAGMAIYHWVSFGSPLRTAYSFTLEQSAFGLSHFVRHLRLYPPAMVTHLLGPLFLLSCCGFAATWAADWRRGLFFTVWVLPLALVYMAYYWVIAHHTVSFMRFFLPLVVPLGLLGLQFLRDAVAGLRLGAGAKAAVVLAALLAQTAWSLPSSLFELEARYGPNARVKREVDFIRSVVPPGATIFGELLALDSLDYTQEYALYWHELLHQETLRNLLIVGGSLRPGPDAMQHERAYRLRDQLLQADPATFKRRICELIDARLAVGRGVYLIAPAELRDAFRSAYSSEYELELVAELPAAEAPHLLFDPRTTLPPDTVYIDRIIRR